MPLLGPQEKAELESLLLERLGAFYDAKGPSALLEAGVGIALSATGPEVVMKISTHPKLLASVETRTLFTAVCHLSSEGAEPLPREMLAALATEAATDLAQQVNRIAPA